jgi:serine/threonine protein kinase
VALKILPAEMSDDPSRRQNLEQEARAVASLNHPHICTLHDIGAMPSFRKMEMSDSDLPPRT